MTDDQIYQAVHAFDIQLEDWNSAIIVGLSRNVLYIVKNISTVVRITHRRNTYKCGIYMQLIVIDLFIGNNY